MIDQSKKEDKVKGLKNTFAEVEKKFGKGTVNFGNSKQVVPILCSTGSLKLDHNVIGIGGIPQGRTIEIYGPESSGKTTIMLFFIAQIQKAGGICAFIDAEHALDPIWATKLGVNMEELIISQPDCGEDALELVEAFIDSGGVDFIVVDSVSALVPKAELLGEMGASHMGLQARLMGQAMRKLTGKIAKSSCTVSFINQIRMKIGVMFGSPETVSGGNALKFFASLRLDVRRPSKEISKEESEGQLSSVIRVKAVKNKVAPPYRSCEMTLYTGRDGIYGFDTNDEIVDLAVANEIMKKAGTWYSYGEERLGQGKENVLNFLKENLEMLKEIKDKVITKMGEDLIYNVPVEGSFQDVVNKKEVEDKKIRKRTKIEEPVLEETNIEVQTEELNENIKETDDKKEKKA